MIIKTLIVVAYAITIVYSINQLLDLTDRDSSITNKIPCVLRICSKYFSSKYKLRGSLVIVNFPLNNIVYTDLLLKSFNEDRIDWTIMPKQSDRSHHDPKHVTEKAKNYFFVVNHEYEIAGIIKQLRSLPTWNALAQVLVWMLPHTLIEPLDDSEINECFNILLSAGMINANLLYSYNESNRITVLTWYPYGYGNCAKTVGRIEKVEECEFVENRVIQRDFVNVSDPMRAKIPTKLNNCSLQVSATNWIPFSLFDSNSNATGIETSLIRFIARKLQLNPVFRNRNSNRANTIVTNKTYADLLEKKVDVMIGGLDENPVTRKLLSSSISYFEDDVTWCVPVAQPKPTYENVFVIFELETWILTFTMAILAGIMLFYFHRKHDLVKKPHYDISWALLLSYSVTLSCPGNYYPKVTYLRIIFIGLVLYGIHINIAYHSKLISFLTKPRFQTQVNSLTTAAENNFELAGGIANLEYLTTNHNMSEYVMRHMKVCSNIDACFEQVRYKQNYAVSISRAHAQNLNLTGKQYYCFSHINNVYPFSISMVFQRQHHLLAKFNEIIRRCMEAGLIKRWIDQTTFRNQRLVSNSNDGKEGYIVLTLDHVQGAFIIWFIGIGLSIVFFIAEVTLPNCKKTWKTIRNL